MPQEAPAHVEGEFVYVSGAAPNHGPSLPPRTLPVLPMPNEGPAAPPRTHTPRRRDHPTSAGVDGPGRGYESASAPAEEGEEEDLFHELLDEKISLDEKIELQQAEEALKALMKFDKDEDLKWMNTQEHKEPQEERDEEKRMNLIREIVKKRPTVRDFIYGLHVANLHLQSQQAIFKYIDKFGGVYRQVCPVIKKWKEKAAAAGRLDQWAKRAEKTLKAVEEKIIRYSVSTMEVTGPVGESPVHLAFLFGLSDLGKRMIETTARVKTLKRLTRPRQGIRMQAILNGSSVELRMSYDTDGVFSSVDSLGVLQVIDTKAERKLFDINFLNEVEALGYKQENTPKVKISFPPGSMHSNQDDKTTAITVQLSASQEGVDMSKDMEICARDTPDRNEIEMWAALRREVLDLQVMYAVEKARVINMPYKSDLEPWLSTEGVLGLKKREKLLEVCEKKRVPVLDKVLESGMSQARCTLGICSNIHPWCMRGTLRPFKTKTGQNDEKIIDDGECKFCEGKGGKDGGLFTGETLLHIAIIQQDHQMVRYLLQGGADLDDRALGVFFQPARISQFEADQNFMKFRQLDKNQLYRYILKFDSRACDLKSRTLMSLGANTLDTRPENPTMNMLVYTKRQRCQSAASYLTGRLGNAVGDVQICMQLLDFYLKRLDRMICLVNDYENNKEIHDQFFTQKEAAPEAVRLDVKGGQLFSCQQVEDFKREMIEWISDGKNGGGFYDYNNEEDRKMGIKEYRSLLQSAFLNRQNSKGNTALHLAVFHNRMPVVDWLLGSSELQEGHWAEPSLSMLNSDALTPFTMSVRWCPTSTLIELMNKHKVTVWKYGSVELKSTNLKQIDTYRIRKEKAADDDQQPNEPSSTAQVKKAYHQRAASWDSVQRLALAQNKEIKPVLSQNDRKKAMVKSFTRLLEFAEERYQGKALHEHKDWKSALEIVVHHEVGALLGHAKDGSEGINEEDDEHDVEQITLFQELIAEKWKEFARDHHLIWNLFPHLYILCIYMLLVILRVTFLYENRFGAAAPGAWHIYNHYPTFDPNAARWINWYCTVVLIHSIPFLFFKSHQESRLSKVDLDPNQDQQLSFHEILIFAYKNLGSLLNATAGVGMIAQAVVFYETRDISKSRLSADLEVSQDILDSLNRECQIIAFVAFLLWFKLLHLFVPFEMTGSMLIIVWRMILNDMSQFFSVYVLILFAFSASSYVLVLNHHLQEGIAITEGVDDETDFSSFVIRHFYISLGEVDSGATQTTFLTLMHLTFVIMNTLLMLNLLIAMMSDTYAADRSKQGKIMWWLLHAHTVLRYEQENLRWYTQLMSIPFLEKFAKKKLMLQRSGQDSTPALPNPEARPFHVTALERTNMKKEARKQEKKESKAVTKAEKQAKKAEERKKEVLEVLKKLEEDKNVYPAAPQIGHA